MTVVHHTAICTRDIDAGLRFWRDALGFEVLMDETFTGDWPTLLRAPGTSLRSVFLGDPSVPDAGIVELVDLGDVAPRASGADGPTSQGFLIVSVVTDLEAALDRLAEAGLGGAPRRIDASGVAMAVVVDPDGVAVELIDDGVRANLERLAGQGGRR